MKAFITILFLVFSLISFGQEKLYGEYITYHIVNGYQLEIKPQNKFELTEVASMVLNPPLWTGNWETKGDTLRLHFDADSMGTYVHIIEDEFLIRTNLKEFIINDSIVQFEFPHYLYKTVGKYPNGNTYCQTDWKSMSTTNLDATKIGEWKYYYPEGGLQKVERFKKGLQHGETEHFNESGHFIKIEKWKKGKLKKTKRAFW